MINTIIVTKPDGSRLIIWMYNGPQYIRKFMEPQVLLFERLVEAFHVDILLGYVVPDELLP